MYSNWSKLVIIFQRSSLLTPKGDQWWIQDYLGVPSPRVRALTYYLTQNVIKMKEIGPRGGARVPSKPIDLPQASYHPSFRQQPSGGFLSWTFSTDIWRLSMKHSTFDMYCTTQYKLLYSKQSS